MILWTGVAVGLLGLAATASNGVTLLLRSFRTTVRAAIQRLRPKRKPKIHYVYSSDGGTGSDSAVAIVIPAAETASVEKRLGSLEARVGRLETETQAHQKAVAGSVAAMSSNVASLSTRVNRGEIDAALADARGLGPVAFGFVMTAVAHQLASLALFGAFFTVAALFVTARVGWLVFPSIIRESGIQSAAD